MAGIEVRPLASSPLGSSAVARGAAALITRRNLLDPELLLATGPAVVVDRRSTLR